MGILFCSVLGMKGGGMKKETQDVRMRRGHTDATGGGLS